MKGYIGVTDNDWFAFLSLQPGIDEVNFWQPGGRGQFKALRPREPFFFKLKAPHHHYIAGGGFFAHHTILPISLAWSAFGHKNGAKSFTEMRRLIERNRHSPPSLEDYKIGCILLSEPFFLKPSNWIPVPPDFNLNIVQGKGYDLTVGHGRDLWQKVEAMLKERQAYHFEDEFRVAEAEGRYGQPTWILPRLGQGTFRVIVTDAYQRRCAITQEKTLPVLEAAHIKPFSESGPNQVDNGLLLRSDIHRLFDSGYVTVTTDHHFEVSRRIKEEFDNGKEYEKLNGNMIYIPMKSGFRPNPEFLTWHNENVFRS